MYKVDCEVVIYKLPISIYLVVLFAIAMLCSFESAADSYNVYVVFKSDSSNIVRYPEARKSNGSTPVNRVCGDSSSLQLSIYSRANAVGQSAHIFPITIKCPSDEVNVGEFVQTYIDEAIVASGGGNNSIIIPEGALPEGSIMQSFCIRAATVDFGCTSAQNYVPGGGGSPKPSCSFNNSLSFQHEVKANSINGDKKTLELAVNCSSKTSAKISINSSSGVINIGNNTGITSAISVEGKKIDSNGVSFDFLQGTKRVSVMSSLSSSSKNVKGGTYAGSAVLTLSIE
jgi:hypothetical protein